MLFIPFAVSAGSLIFGPTGLVFVAAILAAFGVFWQAAKESEVQRQLVGKNEEIAKKSEEIADLNKRIAGLVTGGDGFCYLWLTNIDSGKNLAILSSFQQGEFPIYDVDARIVDLQQLKPKKPPLALDNFLAGQIFLNLGTMRVDGIKMLSSNFPLSQSDKRDFNVFFTARNGAYMQFLRLRRVQHEWRQATRVIVDEKVVFEKVDKDFPKDQLDWTSKETAEPILPSE
jgi:hypothetical protein